MIPLLVVFGGLPGTGKTTIAREVAHRTGSLYVRIDTIEHSIRTSHPPKGDIGAVGYVVAQALARENLAVGQTVIADAVNPVPEARQAWRDIAAELPAALIEIEILCSDAKEHRRRVETRTPDIDGFTLPTWEDVERRDYVPWTEDHWVIDTCLSSVEEAVTAICTRMYRECPHPP